MDERSCNRSLRSRTRTLLALQRQLVEGESGGAASSSLGNVEGEKEEEERVKGKRTRRQKGKVGSSDATSATGTGSGGVSEEKGGKRRKKENGEAVTITSGKVQQEVIPPKVGATNELEKRKEEEDAARGKFVLEKGENPLLNSKFLEKLFHLYPPSYQDLLSIRLVSKTWFDASLGRWRGLAVLKLVPENTVFRNTDAGGIKPTELLARLEDPNDPYQLNTKPYSKFKFSGIRLDMSIRNKGLSNQFWKLVGPSMTYLHLNKCEFLEITTKPFEWMVLEKTPKLQEIVITDTGMIEQPYGPDNSTVELKKRHNLNVKKVVIRGGIPLKLQDLLRMFPNMKELTLRNGQHAKYSSSVITMLNNLRRDSRFKKYKLEKLDIKGTFIINNSIINPFMGPVSERWNQLKCNLKTLCLELTPLERADSIFQPLLQANKNVETLELCIVPRYPTSTYHGSDRFQFRSTMEFLTDLRLWGNVIQNFKFLKFLPNLKRLYCNPLCFEKWAGRGKHHQPCTKDLVKNTRLGVPFTLNSMEYLHVDHELSTMCVKKLSEWMPNLKVLKTILNEQTFPMVCHGWPELRELRLLFGSSLDDETVAGVKSPEAPKTKRKKTSKQSGSNACLTDLRQLNVFTFDAYCNEAKLADISVRNGFLKIPSLVTLQICVSEQMSEEAETSLKKQIPCVRVMRNGGLGPHGDYECCLRKKFLARSNTSEDEEENLAAAEVLLSDEDSDDMDDDDSAHTEFLSDSDEEGPDLGDNHHPLPPLPAFLPVLFAFQQIVDGDRAAGGEPFV